jgi:hypothetical protein
VLNALDEEAGTKGFAGQFEPGALTQLKPLAPTAPFNRSETRPFGIRRAQQLAMIRCEVEEPDEHLCDWAKP